MRTFIWRTTPLYVVFAAVGLYASGFQLTPNLVVLVGLLAAFGVLDAVALAQIRGIESRPRP